MARLEHPIWLSSKQNKTKKWHCPFGANANVKTTFSVDKTYNSLCVQIHFVSSLQITKRKVSEDPTCHHRWLWFPADCPLVLDFIT
jgi:hypothetical protein